MAKNKANKKRTKPKGSTGMKGKPTTKTVEKKLVKKRGAPKKKLAKKKPALKKAVMKTKSIGRKITDAKTRVALRTRVRRKKQSVDTEQFAPEELGGTSGGQSGDLQGLSNIEGADSESVSELIEEGNAFEADAVTGVEHADDADEKEVRTHEVPQDDVPDEYRDK
jgi:hypothetical protein